MTYKYSHVVLVTGARSWDDEQAMRATFHEVWRSWGKGNVRRPVLLSGHCKNGADAVAEKLWRGAGFQVLTFPADWGNHGRTAGLRRNREMVNAARQFRDAGARVVCTVFLDVCTRSDCPHQNEEQQISGVPRHFSHGTIHCRSLALQAGLDVVDTMRPPLAPT